jgi:hypothetical protein
LLRKKAPIFIINSFIDSRSQSFKEKYYKLTIIDENIFDNFVSW